MLGFAILVYLIYHSPALVMLIVGLFIRKSKPKAAKVLFILSAIYFVVGAGVCGLLL